MDEKSSLASFFILPLLSLKFFAIFSLKQNNKQICKKNIYLILVLRRLLQQNNIHLYRGVAPNFYGHLFSSDLFFENRLETPEMIRFSVRIFINLLLVFIVRCKHFS